MKLIKSFSLFEASQVIQRGTDPYEYKVDNDHWLARKKGTDNWKEITGKDYKPEFQSSINKLDSENPNLRTDKAPNKSGGGSKDVVNKEVESPKEIQRSEVEQVVSGVGDLSQKMGLGKEFGESQKSQYQNYKNNPSVYWAVYDIDNGRFLSRSSNADELVYAASVSKIITGACALHKNGGKLPTDKDLDKLKLLLIESNNDMWRPITTLAGGGDEVNSWSKQMGWGMNPGNYCKNRPSKNNYINATGMCLFWKDALTNRFSGAAMIKQISGACQTNTGRSRVYIPKDCQVGSKTGLYNKSMHDSGWIITKNGRKFAITVLTELASTAIVAIMFGGLFREYCQGSVNQVTKQEVKKELVSSGGKLPIVFVAGLDNRSGDLSLEEQTKSVLSSLGNRQITSFCAAKSCKKHTDVSTGAAMSFLKKNPNSIVLLFSAGTQYSKEASNLISDKKNLFILEPYAGAKSTVQGAVNNGVPSTNVIVGKGAATGQGILGSGGSTTQTPPNFSHFGSLKFASQIISKL